MDHYYVYIIQSEVDGSFYKGFTTNYLKRLEDHNSAYPNTLPVNVPGNSFMLRNSAPNQKR